jgi:hypothetical protein
VGELDNDGKPLRVSESDDETQPLEVSEGEELRENVSDAVGHAEVVVVAETLPLWEVDAQPLTVPLPVGLCVKLTVDDPQPLNEAVTELKGLCVGLRVAQALAVKELVAHAE